LHQLRGRTRAAHGVSRSRADLYHGDKLIRRGRPPSDHPKQALKLRIDADVVEHFRATGPGWQTRINDTLRRAAKLKARA
jgi:uncharacterized protein (DUF4415 family)